MGNIDNSLVEAARVDGATEFQVFWKIKWPSLLPTTFILRSSRPLTLSNVSLWSNCWHLVVLISLNEYPYILPLWKPFKLSEYGCHHGCFSLRWWLPLSVLRNSRSRKRRRILKKGASDETNIKETYHCLYSILNDHFAPLTSLVHFPILLILDSLFKFLSQSYSWSHLNVAKDTNHGKLPAVDEITNPALQWLWNSVFISCNHAFGVYDLFLGRLCLGEETLLWAT